MDEKVPILISACLLGKKVRYDGGHKHAPFLDDAFGDFVRWIPVCPEVECGLPVPREPMILKGDPGAPRLSGRDSGADHTERLERWTAVRLAELESAGLCGYICKRNSPSCSGIGWIDVFGDAGAVSGRGSGVFTKAFAERFPEVPVEEEGRLLDPSVREAFIETAFALHGVRRGTRSGGTRNRPPG